jgi:hypothetical protein
VNKFVEKVCNFFFVCEFGIFLPNFHSMTMEVKKRKIDDIAFLWKNLYTSSIQTLSASLEEVGLPLQKREFVLRHLSHLFKYARKKGLWNESLTLRLIEDWLTEELGK